MFLKVGTARAYIFLFLTGFAALPACTSSDIYNDPDFNPPVFWGSHIVQEGDSLYAIAWRYGRDPMEIARANHLRPPYRIYPGQRLTLEAPPAALTKKSSGRSSATTRSNDPKVASTSKSSAQNYKNKQKPATVVTSRSSSSTPKWQWPHSGPIIDTYSVTGRINKGIDIAGKIGDPVLAASEGEVVYAGSGLIGYGLLIIINHSDEYLSAYAHNHKILVKEGSVVRRGTKIAELGDAGTSRPKLHFEIRKNGQPVNPLSYLPKR